MLAERKFGVSADSSGVLGTPKTWKDVYGFLFDQRNFVGVEAVGWRWIKSLLRQAHQQDIDIVGIHGKMGNPFSDGEGDPQLLFRLTLVDGFIKPAEDLVNLPSPYLLLHEPVVRKQKGKILQIMKQTQKTLFIENSIVPLSLSWTKQLAEEFSTHGVEVGIMFDLYHYACEFGSTSGTNHLWDKILNELKNTLEFTENQSPTIRAGVHLPIGEDTMDSLTFEQMSQDMWQQLTAILNSHPNTLLIIENQQTLKQKFGLTKNEVLRQTAVNEGKLNTLFKTGVIQG